jgi:hypothetical protein
LQGDVVTSATARQLLRQLLADGYSARPLIDIGSSTVSGLRHPNPFPPPGHPGRTVAHPVQHTRLLDTAQATALGSDTVHAGWTFTTAALDSTGSFTDAVGIRWVWSHGAPTPLGHPLERAGVRRIRRYPHPRWPVATPTVAAPATTPGATPAATTPEQPRGTDCETGHIVVVEPPCPGILELAMALRNPWQFMRDTTDSWQVAGALLDWSLETLLDAYSRTLTGLPEPPDLLVYPDRLGFRAGMFLSAADYRAQLQPRLRVLLTRLRELSGAPVLFHCRGAVGPVLTDLALLEPELLHFERDLAGVDLGTLRAAIPATTGLHGVIDLVRLGRALTAGNQEVAVREAVLLARAWPAMAAPLGIVTADAPASELARAASFIRTLSPATLRALLGEPDPNRVLAPLFCRARDANGARDDHLSVLADTRRAGARIELDDGAEAALTLP